MLDGNRYFAEFPDEHPARRGPPSADLRRALAALEREIIAIIGMSPDSASGGEGASSTASTSARNATGSA